MRGGACELRGFTARTHAGRWRRANGSKGGKKGGPKAYPKGLGKLTKAQRKCVGHAWGRQ
jgi:hypothetical protein